MGSTENGLAIASLPDAEVQPLQAIFKEPDNSNLTRHLFGKDFVFGSGTAAYQVEGGACSGGRGPSIWDDFTLRFPGKISGGSNGNVACDTYTRYKEDIRAMKKMGFDAYRFSISWSRILPGGRCAAGINREGIDYYNDVIDTVIANGMKPYVTLFHFDTPLTLQMEYGGFMSKKIIDDFREYTEMCFWEFGDRVKWWTTINEPWTYAVNGYVMGAFPPGISLLPPSPSAEAPQKQVLMYRRVVENVEATKTTTTTSNSYHAKDAYTVARNLLLAHSEAFHTYKTKFQELQGGVIGIVLNSSWHVPLDDKSQQDKDAVKRALDFTLGWFLEPVLYGKYPESMIKNVPADNLAHFSHQESEMLKNSVDYVGLNYYTANYVSYVPNPQGVGYLADGKFTFEEKKHGIPIGPVSTGSSWLCVCPWGIYDHLVYMKNAYPNIPPIYITENGYSGKNECGLTAIEARDDTVRTKYHQDHLANILKAMKKNKVDVRGYFVWSWCDNFEWSQGYEARFGITYIDYVNHLTRYPKHSAIWFAKFLYKGETRFPVKTRPVPLPLPVPINDNSDDQDEMPPPEKRLRIDDGE